MMLMVGGCAQGKRALAQEKYGLLPEQIADGQSCLLEPMPDLPALDRLHLLICRLMQAGISPQDYLLQMLSKMPDMLLICDEIGCGIVPADAFEREWREQTGRLCCLLAQKSKRVERVTAGMITTLKEGN